MEEFKEQQRAMWAAGDYATLSDHIRDVGSVEGFADYFSERFGPLVTARQMLGDRFAELRADMVAIWSRRNAAENGGFRLAQEYLVSIVQL